MDDHLDICRVFEISKFDIARLTCILYACVLLVKHKTVSKSTASSDISQKMSCYNCQICPFPYNYFDCHELKMYVGLPSMRKDACLISNLTS